MICLDFAVSGLMLKKKQYTYLVAGTKNCISIKVKLDWHWQDLEVFAVCYRDNKEYPYAITNGECLIADMAVISTSGEFKLKLLGSTADGNVVMTTNVVTVYINDNKFSGAEGGELEYPTSDYLAEVLAGSKQAAEQAKHSADAAGESAKQAKLSAEQVSRDVELAGEYVKQIEGDATQVGKLAQQVTEQAEQVNRDAEQVASDKKSVTELTGQAVEAAGNAQTYMEQTGQIKADAQTMLDNASQAMAEVIGNAKTDLNGTVSKAKADIDAQGTEIITQATAQADRAQGAADGIRDTADTLQADNEHLKAELKHANRRISVLYDLGKGITHRYETDSETAYSKDVPSGAKVMDVKLIGGRSVASNQSIQDVKFETDIDANSVWRVYGTQPIIVNNNVAMFTVTEKWQGVAQFVKFIKNHKYYMYAEAKSDRENNTILCPYVYQDVFGTENSVVLHGTEWSGYAAMNIAAKSIKSVVGVRAAGATTVIGATISCKNIQCIDLTQMFGAGNEPTLEQFQAMLTRPDYPYNAGTLVSADVTDVQVGDKVISLPNKISLKSAGSVYDSLEFYEQNGKYYQRHTQRVVVVPSIELASCQVKRVQSHDIPCFVMICDKLNERSKPIQTIQINRYTSAMELGRYVDVDMMCINDGVSAYNLCWRNDSIQSAEAFQKHLVDDNITIYYELATPIVTVTEVDNRFDAIDCKAGDKITFVGNSDYHLPVPNEEEYLIALNEVTA